jgi:hypothetical protein
MKRGLMEKFLIKNLELKIFLIKAFFEDSHGKRLFLVY